VSKSLINYQVATFVTSAPDISAMPDDDGIEVAFAGRSNAGKSSALNTLTNQKLARTSKTPGRTQLINVFDIRDNRRLIDLPGYGFAKVPLEMKKKWQKSLGEYLQNRDSLKGLVVLMDIRHPLKELDQELVLWAIGNELPVLILLTKADKLKPGKRKQEVLKVRQVTKEFKGDVEVHSFSSLKGTGLNELAHKLDHWFGATALIEAVEKNEQDESE
jgi:GTP-binding protein